MLLNNATHLDALFALSTGSGRSVNFNVNAGTITDVSVKNFEGPFNVTITVENLAQREVGNVSSSDCISACFNRDNIIVVKTLFHDSL